MPQLLATVNTRQVDMGKKIDLDNVDYVCIPLACYITQNHYSDTSISKTLICRNHIVVHHMPYRYTCFNGTLINESLVKRGYNDNVRDCGIGRVIFPVAAWKFIDENYRKYKPQDNNILIRDAMAYHKSRLASSI